MVLFSYTALMEFARHYPLTTQRRHRRRRRLKLYAWGGILGLLLIGAAYVVIDSTLLRVRTIAISGNERLAKEAIIGIVQHQAVQDWHGILDSANYLAWSSGDFSFSGTALISAAVTKNIFSRSLDIQVRERQPFAVWCSPENQESDADYVERCFWFDREGIAFEPAPLTEGRLITTVRDTERVVNVGMQIMDGRFISNFIKILESLPALNFHVTAITFNRAQQDVYIDLQEGMRILLSVRFDSTSNLKAIQTLGASLPFTKIEYADARVENKIYYKNR